MPQSEAPAASCLAGQAGPAEEGAMTSRWATALPSPHPIQKLHGNRVPAEKSSWFLKNKVYVWISCMVSKLGNNWIGRK